MTKKVIQLMVCVLICLLLGGLVQTALGATIRPRPPTPVGRPGSTWLPLAFERAGPYGGHNRPGRILTATTPLSRPIFPTAQPTPLESTPRLPAEAFQTLLEAQVRPARRLELREPLAERTTSHTLKLEPIRLDISREVASETRARLHELLEPNQATRPGFEDLAGVVISPPDRLSRAVPAYTTGNHHTRAAGECVVNSAADSGPGTLRQCMEDAVTGDIITFDPAIFPPNAPVTITLASTLPWITTDDLTIDGSDAGVILDGGGLSEGYGLVIWGVSGVTIRGLQILRFPSYGVSIITGTTNTTIGGERSTGNGPLGQGNLISGNRWGAGIRLEGTGVMSNTIQGNFVGTDISGTAAFGNRLAGIVILDGAANNLIGGNTPEARNLISGNWLTGVWIEGIGASGNQVVGNYVGTDISGAAAFGHIWDGIYIGRGAANNTISHNLISGNRGNGVWLQNVGTVDNLIQDNYIGTDLSGTAPLGNLGDGVFIGGEASNNIISGNLISGNGESGVQLQNPGTIGNLIQDNHIGTNLSGTTALGNLEAGVGIIEEASNNVISGNLISGNEVSGIYLRDSNTIGNLIQDNHIGTNLAGTAAIGNLADGVFIGGEASNNVISGNLISGNFENGVYVTGMGTNENQIIGNFIGINISGTIALGNTLMGVCILDGASSNIVGGSNLAARNLISGNGYDGIVIYDPETSSNQIVGNYIGTNVSGTGPLGNRNGVLISFGATDNIIGGETEGAGNLISGNRDTGVWLQNPGTSENQVIGNRIGTDASGFNALGNGGFGVLLGFEASRNIIGVRNIISGNGDAGIWIEGVGTMSNTIRGNHIGLNISGEGVIGNAGSGVTVIYGPTDTIIGGNTSEERNIISGNNGDAGIDLVGYETTGNLIQGNYIGTNSAGTIPLGNIEHGIAIHHGAKGNIVGGVTAQARNLISGNGQAGVLLYAQGTSENQVLGNYIGTDVSGANAIANLWGVFIGEGATNSTIGGTISSTRNLISGNAESGVRIEDSSTMSNTVMGNYIGTDSLGMFPLPNEYGVTLSFGATNNIVGGSITEMRNIISGNRSAGVVIWEAGAPLGNQVLGNYIGTDVFGQTSLPNSWGIYIDNQSMNNLIGISNTIAYNLLDGVYVNGTDTLSNTITRNSIFDNSQLGIETTNGGNTELTPPKITEVIDTSVLGKTQPYHIVEVFSDNGNEGRWFEGRIEADEDGVFSLTGSGAFKGLNLTATAIDAEGNTSEFSEVFPLAGVILTPAAITITVSTDGIITYTHTLINIGPGADTFTLSATSDHGWLGVYQSSQVTLDAGMTETINVTITVPDDLSEKVVDRTMITATSWLNPEAIAWAEDTIVFERPKIHLPLIVKN